MLERDVGEYEAVATNGKFKRTPSWKKTSKQNYMNNLFAEHGSARQRVRLEIAEYPRFIQRPDETFIMTRRNGRLEARVCVIFKIWQRYKQS